MKNDAVVLKIGPAILQVVPAIHYRLFFARAVHRVCISSKHRPAAIAVELGPETAASVALWIRELACQHKALPVLLGLLIKNRLIPAGFRDRAECLQKQSCRDLSEMDGDILRERLNFYPERLLPLSPTDSIIEAIRFAVVNGLPVYGVDLEESADDDDQDEHVFQQPVYGQPLNAFSGEAAGYAALHAHGEADHRREYAMASRLKTLLDRHGNVLFTCGLAHWKRIEALLQHPDVRPAPVPVPVGRSSTDCRREIVGPSLAVRFLDLFPAVIPSWEKVRAARRCKMPLPDPNSLLEKILGKSFQKFFSRDGIRQRSAEGQTASPDMIRRFSGYLNSLALLEHYPVPDMALALSAARETMDPAFVNTLAGVFMDFPWVKPADFPDCGYLTGSLGGGDRMTLVTDAGKEEISVRPLKPAGQDVLIPEEIIEKEIRSLNRHTSLLGDFSWLPWDRLITASSIKAIAASRQGSQHRAVIIDNSILDGLDVKATLRSHSRCENKIYVRERTIADITPGDSLHGFPVVWIFTDTADHDDSWRKQVFTSRHLRPHARNKRRFDRLLGNSHMIPIVGYGRRAKDERMTCDLFSGLVIYHPTCFTNRQHTLWLEHTGYRRAPICPDDDFSGEVDGLKAIIRDRLGVNIEAHDWKMGLIIYALPFADGSLTVVGPDGFQLDETVLGLARRLNITIHQTSLNHFSIGDCQRLARCHFAPCTTLEPVCRYAKDVEQAIGESQDAYARIVPRQVTDFGMWP